MTRGKGDGEMTNEAMKAVLMIAMFGTLEFALYFSRIRKASASVCRSAAAFLTQAATIEHVFVPVRVHRKTG